MRNIFIQMYIIYTNDMMTDNCELIELLKLSTYVKYRRSRNEGEISAEDMGKIFLDGDALACASAGNGIPCRRQKRVIGVSNSVVWCLRLQGCERARRRSFDPDERYGV